MSKNRLLNLLLLVLLLAMGGCDKAGQKKKVDWEVTLDDSKGPHGLFIADQSLKYYFPEAKMQSLSKAFKYTNMDNKMKYATGETSLLILGGLDFYVTSKEWEQLKDFAANGNEVMIFCSVLDTKIQEELGCKKYYPSQEEYPITANGTDNVRYNTITINNRPGKSYTYKGRWLKGYFSYKQLDTARSTADTADSDQSDELKITGPEVLGKNEESAPDILRYKVGEGHIILHAAPLVLSNYFLLQAGNKDYLDALWSTLPGRIDNIYLNEYKKRDSEESDFAVLWRYPATRLALLLAIAALLLYVLFEGKRKQRIIPVIPPLRNESVSFVETVGRLYYNKGDNSNLAGKMVQQFLEWVRSTYLLNTNLLNEQFITQLTIKSGKPEATVRAMMEMIHEIKTGTAKTDDAYLYQLYNTIQEFYKNHR